MKILVIEDNPDIKEVLNYLLNDDGHEVVTCSDGRSLVFIHDINPGLILMDEILAGPRGSELCKRLKSNDDTRDIPVVLISALPGVSEIARQCGADAYLEKPFNIDYLSDLIKGFAIKQLP